MHTDVEFLVCNHLDLCTDMRANYFYRENKSFIYSRSSEHITMVTTLIPSQVRQQMVKLPHCPHWIFVDLVIRRP